MKPAALKATYSEMLHELSRRELAVLEQKNRIDTFVLKLLSEANFEVPRTSRCPVTALTIPIQREN